MKPKIEIKEREDEIFSHIRNKWLKKTPEEYVRQQYLCTLINDYNYKLNQIIEEVNVTGRGSAQARADFVIYKSAKDIELENNPIIIVECKADNIVISEKDYLQGELYARLYNSPFFVTHNTKETKFWRILKDKSPGYREEIENIPNNNESKKRIEELLNSLMTFKKGEFKKVLNKCHDIIRDNEKLDPLVAFDEISKILFMKVYAERHLKSGEHNVFSLKWIKEAEKYTANFIAKTFDDTKTEFGKSIIFKNNEQINLSNRTIKQIISKLEKYNLSATSVDTKGMAFENFLSDTFRGSLGQFFTPRPVVDFMINMIKPTEKKKVCDPACGSGGFLIQFFQRVQNIIIENINVKYQKKIQSIKNDKSLKEEDKKIQILDIFTKQKEETEILNPNSKLHELANKLIFGTDANERAARTAKMNMIMHGDGHGGIYHHDGFINVGRIKENSFDIILTNPPFGMKTTDKNILNLFELPKNKSITTQVLFIERAIDLLKPKGKLAIVLPNGIFNNPKEKRVREFVENRGQIIATVSIPREVFLSSKADVNCSLLFFKKYTSEEKNKWNKSLKTNKQIILTKQSEERNSINEILKVRISKKDYKDSLKFDEEKKELKYKQNKAKKRLKELNKIVPIKSRILSKKEFDYKIFLAEAEYAGISATGKNIKENDLIEIFKDYKSFKKGNKPAFNKVTIEQFSTISRWDAKKYLYKLTTNYPIKELGKYIYEHSEKLKLFEYPNDDFTILGVTNSSGIYKNFTDKGSVFNQAYKKVYVNEIAYNPYRVNVGSIGIIRNEFHNYYISPAYVIFGIKKEFEKILSYEYLFLVLSSNWYNPVLKATTSGSVRQNLTFDLLSELEIPLPTMSKQMKYVEKWNEILSEQKKIEKKLTNLKLELENDINKKI